MHKPQQQVQELHRDVLNQPVSPAEPQIRMGELRASLILEEAMETAVALVGSKRAAELLVDGALVAKLFAQSHSGFEINEYFDDSQREPNGTKPNLVETIDGLCDVLVVAYGTAEAIGIDIEPFFDEVHRSNLAKAGGPVREDGKRLKPPGWKPPDIAGVLAKVQRGECTCPPFVAEESAIWGKAVHVPGCAWVEKIKRERGARRELKVGTCRFCGEDSFTKPCQGAGDGLHSLVQS